MDDAKGAGGLLFGAKTKYGDRAGRGGAAAAAAAADKKKDSKQEAVKTQPQPGNDAPPSFFWSQQHGWMAEDGGLANANADGSAPGSRGGSRGGSATTQSGMSSRRTKTGSSTAKSNKVRSLSLPPLSLSLFPSLSRALSLLLLSVIATLNCSPSTVCPQLNPSPTRPPPAARRAVQLLPVTTSSTTPTTTLISEPPQPAGISLWEQACC